ncbi:MAG: hypothetical protein KAW12_28915 [Candidatus Aminicenantes bacterium]|nr:hypothetical protein [Candidatus Aminicenantes bacterium]
MIEKINSEKTPFSTCGKWVINLEPGIFSEYKKRIIAGRTSSQQIQDFEEKIEKRVNEAEKNSKTIIAELKKNIDKMKESHISWKSIAETLGIFVGAISLSVGVIISLIFFFLKEKAKVINIEFSFFQSLVVFIIFLVLWEALFLLIFKNRAVKIIKREVEDYLIEKQGNIDDQDD